MYNKIKVTSPATEFTACCRQVFVMCYNAYLQTPMVLAKGNRQNTGSRLWLADTYLLSGENGTDHASVNESPRSKDPFIKPNDQAPV